MTTVTRDVAQSMLDSRSPPWIQELNLEILELEPGRARLRLPYDERIARWGGAICGQAIMAVIDTAMVFAVAAKAGAFIDMSTVNQSTSFLRGAVGGGDLICDVRVIRMGRSLAFGEAVLSPAPGAAADASAEAAEPLAKASLTFALAQPK